MTKPTKKPKAAPTYEEVEGAFNYCIHIAEEEGFAPAFMIADLKALWLRFERTRWKPSD